jgi:hypothetical protein
MKLQSFDIREQTWNYMNSYAIIITKKDNVMFCFVMVCVGVKGPMSASEMIDNS